MYYKFLQQIVLLSLLFISQIFPQNLIFRGKVLDADTKSPLSFANILVSETMLGTAADIKGEFILKLEPGKKKIVFSFIGYQPDTLNINLDKDSFEEILLKPVILNFPEVVVTPGKNPAIPIIEKAISYKIRREKEINNYSMNVYSKGVFRSSGDVNGKDSQISIGTSNNDSDSSKMEIKAIFENYSKGYFKQPDKFVEKIEARKQTANLPPTINLLTGGRFIQNFYEDEIEFFNMKIPSPISSEHKDYYFYFLQDSSVLNNQKIYQVYFAPGSGRDPGFYGTMYILDKIFSIVKLDVNLNNAANPGRLFKNISVYQQFMPFKDSLYFPIDYRLFAEGNVYGLVDFGIELNSLMYDYTINEKIPEDRFDGAVISVLPDADDKDQSYWNNIQTIPSSREELKAYSVIDSIESKPASIWENFTMPTEWIPVSQNINIIGPAGLYHFNRVEGHSLNVGISGEQFAGNRLSAQLKAGYGFSDKKMKSEIKAKYLLGRYRNHSLSLKINNSLKVLFNQDEDYTNFSSTILGLFTKYDYRDYFYSSGFEVNFGYNVFDFLNVDFGFSKTRDRSAFVNTDYSFFYKDREFPANREILETNENLLKVGFDFDFRDYVEDGLYKRKFGDYIIPHLTIGVKLGKPGFLNNYFAFNAIDISTSGWLSTFGSSELEYKISKTLTSGTVPVQYMTPLTGNLSSTGKKFSFRTLRFGEIFGDDVSTISLEHNFKDELFRHTGLGFLSDLQINFSGFLNVAWTSITSRNEKYFQEKLTEFKNPFIETGFGIGHSAVPLKVEFAWKLSHRNYNNFMICLNSVIF